MFFVNQEGKVKVWCDSNIDRLFPASRALGN